MASYNSPALILSRISSKHRQKVRKSSQKVVEKSNDIKSIKNSRKHQKHKWMWMFNVLISENMVVPRMFAAEWRTFHVECKYCTNFVAFPRSTDMTFWYFICLPGECRWLCIWCSVKSNWMWALYNSRFLHAETNFHSFMKFHCLWNVPQINLVSGFFP